MSSTQTSLTRKMVLLQEDVQKQLAQGIKPSFGMLRGLLGARRILILPQLKKQHEVPLPGTEPEQARATVLIEIALVDAEYGEQLSSRWIGQAVDEPMVATDRAVTKAMEDFLMKTFLILPESDFEQDVSDVVVEREQSAIRRQPQGAALRAPRAQPIKTAVAVSSDSSNTAHTMTTSDDVVRPLSEHPPTRESLERGEASQLDLLAMTEAVKVEAANEDAPSEPLPPLTKEWKTANALWRALVNEVAGAEVMDAFEDAIERQHDVDSWRRLTPQQIRSQCQQLKKRSAMASDVRMMSDREEFVLSKLPFIPEGSSLNRLEEELERLSLQVVDRQTSEAFFALYLEKMNADALSEVPGKAAIALARKMRRLKNIEREEFILAALADAHPSTEGDSTSAA